MTKDLGEITEITRKEREGERDLIEGKITRLRRHLIDSTHILNMRGGGLVLNLGKL